MERRQPTRGSPTVRVLPSLRRTHDARPLTRTTTQRPNDGARASERAAIDRIKSDRSKQARSIESKSRETTDCISLTPCVKSSGTTAIGADSRASRSRRESADQTAADAHLQRGAAVARDGSDACTTEHGNGRPDRGRHARQPQHEPAAAVAAAAARRAARDVAVGRERDARARGGVGGGRRGDEHDAHLPR